MHSHVIASLYGVIIRSAKEWWLFREGEHLWEKKDSISVQTGDSLKTELWAEWTRSFETTSRIV